MLRCVGMMEGVFPDRPARFFRETASSAEKEGFFQLDHPASCKGILLFGTRSLPVRMWTELSIRQDESLPQSPAVEQDR